MSSPMVSVARLTRYATPRPVASRRPSEPPSSTGLPVTMLGTVWPMCTEYVSIIHAMTCSFVPRSGAITSTCGPMNGIISCV